MTTKIDILKEVIEKGSKNQTLMVLESLEKNLDDDETVKALADPAVISNLHNMLEEHLGVNRRAMQLKARAINRKRRALLFLRAMQNGVKKLED